MLFRTDYTIYTRPIFDRVRVRVTFNVQIKSSNSMIFLKLAVGELTSPRVIQSATWLTASWFVGELSWQLAVGWKLLQHTHSLTWIHERTVQIPVILDAFCSQVWIWWDSSERKFSQLQHYWMAEPDWQCKFPNHTEIMLASCISVM